MNRLPRRHFLATSLTGAIGIVASVRQVRAAEGGPASPPLKLGLIGAGWYGMVDVEAAFKAGGWKFWR